MVCFFLLWELRLWLCYRLLLRRSWFEWFFLIIYNNYRLVSSLNLGNFFFRLICFGCGWTSYFYTSLLNSIKCWSNDWFWVEAMNLLNHLTILIKDCSIRKRCRLKVVRAELWIILAVKIVDLEAPFFFML
jgi:hypothetical protein